MAKLYGTLQGSRGQATRCGTTRIETVAASWEGAIAVVLRIKDCGAIVYDVSQIPWGNSDARKDIAHGVLYNPNQENKDVSKA